MAFEMHLMQSTGIRELPLARCSIRPDQIDDAQTLFPVEANIVSFDGTAP